MKGKKIISCEVEVTPYEGLYGDPECMDRIRDEMSMHIAKEISARLNIAKKDGLFGNVIYRADITVDFGGEGACID